MAMNLCSGHPTTCWTGLALFLCVQSLKQQILCYKIGQTHNAQLVLSTLPNLTCYIFLLSLYSLLFLCSLSSFRSLVSSHFYSSPRFLLSLRSLSSLQSLSSFHSLLSPHLYSPLRSLSTLRLLFVSLLALDSSFTLGS